MPSHGELAASRAGLGYGNLNIPGVDFVTNQKLLIPAVDLYCLF
jgi:hypothetical protein